MTVDAERPRHRFHAVRGNMQRNCNARLALAWLSRVQKIILHSTEDRWQRTEGRRQRAEGRGQRAEDRWQKTEG
jgi:hypothetical protein